MLWVNKGSDAADFSSGTSRQTSAAGEGRGQMRSVGGSRSKTVAGRYGGCGSGSGTGRVGIAIARTVGGVGDGGGVGGGWWLVGNLGGSRNGGRLWVEGVTGEWELVEHFGSCRSVLAALCMY